MYERKDIRIIPGTLKELKGYGWEYELEPCAAFNAIADILRESNGYDPCYKYGVNGNIDLTRWYEFRHGINLDTFLDNYIRVISTNLAGEDIEEGFIFLKEDEKHQIKFYINENLLALTGKSIRELLVEAKELDTTESLHTTNYMPLSEPPKEG